MIWLETFSRKAMVSPKSQGSGGVNRVLWKKLSLQHPKYKLLVVDLQLLVGNLERVGWWLQFRGVQKTCGCEVHLWMQHHYLFKSCCMNLFGLKAQHSKAYLVTSLVLGDFALGVTLSLCFCSSSNWVPLAVLTRNLTLAHSQHHFYSLNQTLTFCPSFWLPCSHLRVGNLYRLLPASGQVRPDDRHASESRLP